MQSRITSILGTLEAICQQEGKAQAKDKRPTKGQGSEGQDPDPQVLASQPKRAPWTEEEESKEEGGGGGGGIPSAEGPP